MTRKILKRHTPISSGERGARTAARWLIVTVFFALLAILPAFAANDPGHDSLYVLKLGDSNLVGSLNITNTLNASYIRAATLLYGDQLDIRANGTILNSGFSRPSVQAAQNQLFLDANGNLYLNTKSGTSSIVQVGDATNAITFNVSGTILQQNVRICLANGTNCPSTSSGANVTGSGTTNYVSKWTSSTGLGTSVIYDDGTNVGIGTSAPGYLLDVNGVVHSSVSSGSNLILSKTTGASIAFDNGTVQTALIESGSPANANRLEFWTNTATNSGLVERMRIDNVGNVGIGTTGPLSTLQVNSSSNTGSLRITNTTGSDHLFINGSNGNVGIGTTSPNVRLQVVGDVNATNGDAGTMIADIFRSYRQGSDAAVYGSAGNLVLQTTTGNLSFKTGTGGSSQTYMTITSTGQVGIGTAGPTQQLEVKGGILGQSQTNTNQTSSLLVGQSLVNDNTGAVKSAIYGVRIDATNDHSGLAFYTTQSSTLSEKLRIDGQGNVGIGTTTPGGALELWRGTNVSMYITRDDVSGTSKNQTLALGIDGTNGRSYIDSTHYSNGGYPLDLRVRGTTGLTVAVGGNVGIGTTNAVTQLDVYAPGSNDVARFTANGTNNAVVDLQHGNDSKLEAINFLDSSGSAQGQILYAQNSSRNYMTLRTAGSERVRIDSSGNVGIGTTAPAANVDIGNNGQVWIRQGAGGGLASSAGAGLKIEASSAGGRLDAYNYSSSSALNLILEGGGGNVGIGTTNPASALSIARLGSGVTLGSAAGNYGLLGFNREVETGTIINSTQPAYQFSNKGDRLQLEVYNASGSFMGDGLVVSNNSNVGIGTTSPQSILELKQTSGSPLLVINAPNSTFPGVLFQNSGANKGEVAYDIANNAMTFYTNGTAGANERVRIDSSGNVGIGTTTPGEALQVVGKINASADVCITGGACLSTVTSTGGGWTHTGTQVALTTATDNVSVGSTPTFFVDTTNSRVGIGTTAPNDVLEVRSTTAGKGILVNDTGGDAYVGVKANGGTLWRFESIGSGGTPAGGLQLIDRTNSVAAMTWQNVTGNVGIGTTAPGTTFDVNGISTFRNLINVGASGANGFLTWDGSKANTLNLAGASGKGLSLGSNGVYDRVYLDTSGKVGIGTTAPRTLLDLNYTNRGDVVTYQSNGTDGVWETFITGSGAGTPKGYVGAAHSSGGNYALFATELTNAFLIRAENALQLGTNGDNIRMTIDTSGNVGIGTTAPSDKLQVSADNNAVGNGEFAGANLLYNGGAESGADGWTSRDFGIDGSAGSGSVVSNDPFSGSYNFLGSNDGGMNQLVQLIPGAVYTLSAMTRVHAVNSTDSSNGRLVVGSTSTGRDIADTSCNENAYDATPNINKWVLCTVTFTAPSTADVKNVSVYIGYRAEGSTHAIDFDNLMLVRGGMASSYDPVTTYIGSNGATSISGNVGIGTTVPSARLQIVTPVNTNAISVINSSGTNVAILANTDGNTAAGWLQLYQNNLLTTQIAASTGYPTYFNAGSVGIGTTAPSQVLEVNGNITLTGDNTNTGFVHSIRLFGNNAPATNTNRWAGIAEYNHGGNNVNELAFFVDNADTNSEAMRINYLGNVGIGTTSPTTGHLQVQGSGVGQQIYAVSSSTSGNNYGIDAEATGSGGTTNTGVYAVATGATANYAIYVPNAYPAAGANNYQLYLASDSKSYFGGNVGINTTAPSAALEVKGNLNISLGTSGTASSNGCLILPGNGKVCGNSTCTVMYSPNGNTVVQACN